MPPEKLRILIMTKGVNSVVKALTASQHEIIGIVEGFYGKKKSPVRQKIYRRFVLLRENLRPAAKSLRKFAAAKNIPYLRMDNVLLGTVENWIRALQPDLIVVYWLPRILKSEIFTIPPLGTINLHPSLLPAYRGPNPFFWAYFDYNLAPGATVHYIDRGEDTGNIILQDTVPISPGTPLTTTAVLVLEDLGVKLLLLAVDLIAQGQAPRHPQPKESPTPKARHIQPAEYSQLIDWNNWSTARIWHFLRGTDYWLHKSRLWSTGHSGVKWQIQEYVLISANTASPGSLHCRQGRFLLNCQDGIIYLQPKFSLKYYLRDILRLLQSKLFV